MKNLQSVLFMSILSIFSLGTAHAGFQYCDCTDKNGRPSNYCQCCDDVAVNGKHLVCNDIKGWYCAKVDGSSC